MRASKDKIHSKIQHSRGPETSSKIRVFLLKKNAFFYLAIIKGTKEALIYMIMLMDHPRSLYIGTRLFKRVHFKEKFLKDLEILDFILS